MRSAPVLQVSIQPRDAFGLAVLWSQMWGRNSVVDDCELLCDGDYDAIDAVIADAQKRTADMLATPQLEAWVPAVASRLLDLGTLTAVEVDLLRPAERPLVSFSCRATAAARIAHRD